MTHSEIVSFLWSTADLLRDYFRRGKYQDVILPLTVLSLFHAYRFEQEREDAEGEGERP